MMSAESRPSSPKFLDSLSVFLATGFSLSHVPAHILASLVNKNRHSDLLERKLTGAGWVGTFWGVVTYLVLPESIANSPIAIGAATAFAIVVSHRAEKVMNSHDDPRIVIDEWIGVWIALWGIPDHSMVHLISAILLFRVFDVFKGPWGLALQRLPGGWGVTLDDVAAGVLANVGWRLVDLIL